MIFAHCEKCLRLFINTACVEMAICDCGAHCKTHVVKTVSSAGPGVGNEPHKQPWKQREVLGVVRVESVLPGEALP